MFVVFYSTSNVFEAEEILKNNDIATSVVPTPVTDKAYCGVCLKVDKDADLSSISNIEHKRIEG